MKFYVFDKSVVGYKNIIKNKSSQDYLKVEKLQDGLICTIGDGHSSDFFTKSGKGAKFACEVTVDTFKKYINEDINNMKNLLDNKILQKEIYDKWKSKVDLDIQKSLPRAFKYNYLKYGTTLLGVLIKADFILYIKLGDGDILLKKNEEIERALLFRNNSIVDSLVEDKSYEKMIFKIEKNNKDISDVIIFSDGFENSFNYYNQMIDSLNNTIREYKKNVFSKYRLEKTYEIYLNKLSKNKSVDDISIIFVNIL